jgi:dolichol-phosphate mannosyltransferase
MKLASMKSLSVVLPFFNESGSVEEVLMEVKTSLPHAEIIAVDDGSTDGTGEKIAAMQGVRLISLTRNLGQSAALFAGLQAATGEIIAMMDGDGQNDPADIHRLVAALDHADVAYGFRAVRRDDWKRRLASRLANAIRRRALGDHATDTGCSLKVIRKKHVHFLIPFNGLHRYLPALFERAGLKFSEIPVGHRPRKTGVSKYTINGRALRGLIDLVGVRWIMNRMIIWPSDFKK